jgi:hypothetical protein
VGSADDRLNRAPIAALLDAERCLLRRRKLAPDPVGAVAQALLDAWGGPVPAPYTGAGGRIADRVAQFGAAFAAGTEPAYHDRHHTAEATRAAGWLVCVARQAGALDAVDAVRCVLAMAGHDLMHPGTPGPRPGHLEEVSAAETIRLAHGLAHDDLRAVHRLILVTDPGHPVPTDLPGRLVRESDLFASLTPTLGWHLSAALARERRAGGIADADRTDSFAGRLALLRMIPAFSDPAIAFGLAAGCAAQIDAMATASGMPTPERGAATLDAMPRATARAAYTAALTRAGVPSLTA